MTESDSESDLICQFSLAGISVDETLPSRIRDGLCNTIEKEKICAVQLKPRKWARTAVIKCVDTESKNKLLTEGIRIGDKKIDFLDGGSGSLRISVDDAPLNMPSSIISDLLKQYGDVTASRDQAFYVGDERTEWSSGTRLFFLKRVRGAIPPTMDIEFDGFTEKICIRYDGQTLYECRFCKQHVERGSHTCDQKPVKRCFNCQATDHLNFQCKKGKLCHKCSSPGHIARDCKSDTKPKRQGRFGRKPNITLGEMPIAPPRMRRKKRNEGQLSSSGAESVQEEGNVTVGPVSSTSSGHSIGPEGTNTGPTGMSQPSPSPESLIDQAERHIQERNQALDVDALLLGDSNSRGLPLTGDDSLYLNITKITGGGMMINEGQARMESLPDDIGLSKKTVVVVNLGSCHFPLLHGETVQQLFADYVQLLETVRLKCPNARIYITGIPPRRGDLTSKDNRDIRRMNRKLLELDNFKEGLTFINIWVFLSDDKRTLPGLFSDRPEDTIHLSREGKLRVACAILDHLKNDQYRAEAMEDESNDDWVEAV